MAANRALASSSQSALSHPKPPSESLFISDGSEGSPLPGLPQKFGDQDDQKFKRLFFIYDRARKDFEATPAKTLERTKSAKFLRDTTENCLAYIAAKQSQPGAEVTCDGLLLELKSTLEETIAIAEQGSGGKKRRFDENWENVPQEPAKMRGSGQPAVRTFLTGSFLFDSTLGKVPSCGAYLRVTYPLPEAITIVALLKCHTILAECHVMAAIGKNMCSKKLSLLSAFHLEGAILTPHLHIQAQPSGYSDPIPRGQTSENKRRPIAPRIRNHQASPKPDYRQQRMDLAERKRSDGPHQPYPASSHQSVRRGFGDRNRTYAERQPFDSRVFGDRYRPRYK